MKFIIPQNYNFSSKLFGILDYSTVLLNVIWILFIFSICNFIISSFIIKIFVIIILCLPVLIFSFIGFNHENIIYVILYIFKYFSKQKIYLYK